MLAMGWYDLFSRFYDRSLEPLYRDARRAAVEALDLQPGLTVLDLPCGTGQSFDLLAPPLRPNGVLIGVDASSGMLDYANARIEQAGWTHVHIVPADVHAFSASRLALSIGRREVDRLHVFLGLTAFPDWEKAFDRLWDLLTPGGRCVIVDVHSASLGLQGRMVNLVARADIRRRVWEPLERVAQDYAWRQLPSRPRHGGQLFLATGVKPKA